MSVAIDVAVPSAPPPAGPGEAARGRDAGTRGDAVGRETECSHVSAFFASREGRDTLAPLARCCVERAEVPRAAAMACLDCAALCSRAEARAHAAGTRGTDRGEDLDANENSGRDCVGVFVDVRVAELFCATCDARAYNRDFDRAVLGARAFLETRERDVDARESSALETAAADDDDESKRVAKRCRGAAPAEPGRRDENAAPTSSAAERSEEPHSTLESKPKTIDDAELVAMRAADLTRVDALGVPRGVRGVVNLGNTCFMSTVLHATLRSPTVGGFFLRDGHVRELCRRDERGYVSARAEQPPSGLPCLACELDGLVCAMHGGDSKPVVPAAFLHSWWRHAPEHLRGQGQHDAHEFFLGLVSAAHADLARGAARDGDGRRDQTPGLDKGLDSVLESGRVCRESATRGDENVSSALKKSLASDDDEQTCACPMHRAFLGTLRSDVACGACGHVSTKTDPTVGLSLDVPPDGSNQSGVNQKTRVTLEECLSRFTRPERLCDADSPDSRVGLGFACARCGDRAAAKTKQMSLSRAPPTLVMHLKRFRRGAKIDRHVAFPFSLDVAPYAASAAERARCAFGDRVDGERAEKNIRSAYELFAVVVHSGGMESGHYICYVKCQNAWFRCDDHMVSRADPVVVAAAQAYLLFYHAV